MTIKDHALRLQKLNIASIKTQAVKNKASLIEDLQRKQLRQGKDADGNPLLAYFASYAKYKATLSTYYAPLGVPDLYLTGSFHRGIRMKLSGENYTLDSSDSKSGKLEGKYGHIFDLNQASMIQAQDVVTFEFNNLVKQQAGL